MAAQTRGAAKAWHCLDESQKRMLNPHTYPVGLEYGLCERRRALVGKLARYRVGLNVMYARLGRAFDMGDS